MRVTRRVVAAAVAAMVGLGAFLAIGLSTSSGQATRPPAADLQSMAASPGAALHADTVSLTDVQVKAFEIGPLRTQVFPIETGAVGSIDFNEDMAVQVFTPYPGRIIQAFAKLGDDVKKGQPLFTIESPDLINAENTLITAAGIRELDTVKLARARQAFDSGGIARNDLDQAVSDQMGAEGALKAARDAVRIFGKSDAEIDRMVRERKIDPALVVPSPIDGWITARNAAPGLFIQPGNTPAPYTVADLSTKWMLANVVEADIPLFHLGQEVRVTVAAYPDRVFAGRITTIGSTVDPNTHRLLVRSEIRDPQHDLRPGMLATFMIEAGSPVTAMAVPADAVVREGDGTMTVWTTTDRRHFIQRVVKVGLRHDGYAQVTEGVQPGELVVTKGAVFLSNMLTDAPS